jgi:ribosomal protein S18 acetylase RimI-like enzyme
MIHIEPFKPDHLQQAAGLLAQRHSRQRAQQPLLPQRFEQPAEALKALQAAWDHPLSSGAAAFSGEAMLGYLIGNPHFDQQRGRAAWAPFAGHALAPQVSAELYRDLYAAAGPAWLRLGCFDHYVQIPASDSAALEAWFSLSFGKEQAYALCSLTAGRVEQAQQAARLKAATGLVVRKAAPEDRLWMEEASPWIRRYQAGPPVWGAALPEDEPEIRQGYGELVSEPGTIAWLAFLGGRVAGQQVYQPAEPADDSLLTPTACRSLQVASTHPELFRRGIQLALTAAGFADASAAGCQAIQTDWRTTNLSSARFWPRQGFQPVMYRLVRRVDARISWAI